MDRGDGHEGGALDDGGQRRALRDREPGPELAAPSRSRCHEPLRQRRRISGDLRDRRSRDHARQSRPALRLRDGLLSEARHTRHGARDHAIGRATARIGARRLHRDAVSPLLRGTSRLRRRRQLPSRPRLRALRPAPFPCPRRRLLQRPLFAPSAYVGALPLSARSRPRPRSWRRLADALSRDRRRLRALRSRADVARAAGMGAEIIDAVREHARHQTDRLVKRRP